jgi:hypothetical protein
MDTIVLAAEGDTVSGAITTALGGFADQLWLIAPAGLAIGIGIMWAIPKAKAFIKKVAG